MTGSTGSRPAFAHEPARGMGDEIRLSGLRVRGFHGVFEFEKRRGQDFVVDVVLIRDLSAPAATDDLADTADYGSLADRLAEIVAGEPYDLIEALAGALVQTCLEYAPEARVTVRKPQAPITHDFTDVSVTLHRRRGAGAAGGEHAGPHLGAVQVSAGQDDEGYEAVVALGANLGDARAALRDAVRALSLHPRITVLAGSSIFATAPVGGIDQPDFLNAVVTVATPLPPRELLAVCQGIEVAEGRTREVRWGPRTLDVDLISVQRVVPGPAPSNRDVVPVTWADDVLSLPHPLAGERAFVLAPWAQLQPEAVVATPHGRLSVAEALATAEDADGIRETSDPVFDGGESDRR